MDEHFKYGSIGAEVDGFPYSIWRELPTIFADDLPNGFAEFGFLTEEGHDLPIGVSVRRIGVPRVGFNCGTCHVSAYRLNGEEHLVMGAPANALNLQAYITFLTTAATDDRLTADAVIEAAEANGRPPGFLEKMVLRFVVFPRLGEQVAGLKDSLAWLGTRPAHGPGRTDAGNFWRERWGLEPDKDSRVGTVDFPSVWNQRIRLDGWFHWDGNNASLDERNISAALAGGAQEWLLERHSIDRISDWLMDFPPPAFPVPYDEALATEGRVIYEREACDSCHDPGAAKLGQVTSSDILGTDRERTGLFDEIMVRYFRTVGEKYSWQFRNYRVTDGYANMPLDGIWMRAPYLHNGSVPTLADLLAPPNQRPASFFRGCGDFDPVTVGFICSDGFQFDTRLTGNGNSGHVYGTGLPEAEKNALLEYLKSL
ncbi:membrane protein [Leisingera methylohalidivorans DSM 14336]|uniref:Membrane protein n=1 Tax=Leisingera methylohalidivorans DSM 14336 TaxID=999552 RepID=V9VWZ3_9RHOB|nr:membrane protein [Leisingera methylohalidivorans DSM 14336]